STAGSPRALTRSTSRTRRRCWTRWPEAWRVRARISSQTSLIKKTVGFNLDFGHFESEMWVNRGGTGYPYGLRDPIRRTPYATSASSDYSSVASVCSRVFSACLVSRPGVAGRGGVVPWTTDGGGGVAGDGVGAREAV